MYCTGHGRRLRTVPQVRRTALHPSELVECANSQSKRCEAISLHPTLLRRLTLVPMSPLPPHMPVLVSSLLLTVGVSQS
jgi:hypothetical protein